jgi:hypothetical protein
MEILGISPAPQQIPVIVPVLDQDQVLQQAAETLQDMQNGNIAPHLDQPASEDLPAAAEDLPAAEHQPPIAEHQPAAEEQQPAAAEQQPAAAVIHNANAAAAEEPPRKKQRQLDSLRTAQSVVHTLVAHMAVSQPLMLASQIPVTMSGLAGLNQALSEFPQLQNLMPLVPPELAPLVPICLALDGMMSSIATKMIKVQEAMLAAEQEIVASAE